MNLSVIIVNWNSAKYLEKCLFSIRRGTYNIDYEIIVVDSGSFDGCAEILKQNFPDCIFIQSSENLGFAKANNLGALRATGDCLLFLNPDTEVEDGAINLLYETLSSLKCGGIIGAKLLNSDLTLQTSCVQAFPTIINQALDSELLRSCFPRARLWGTNALFASAPGAIEADVISGACMMLTAKTFVNVGGFSEDYFMYSEDVDLCYKVKKAGGKNYYFSNAKIIHHGGASSGHPASPVSCTLMRESVRLFFAKTRSLRYANAYRRLMAIPAACRLLILVGTSCIRGFDRQSTRISPGFRKWCMILRWSLGLDARIKNA